MSKKPSAPKKKPADKRTQGERFIDFAKAHGATEDVLDKALGDVGAARKKAAKPEDHS